MEPPCNISIDSSNLVLDQGRSIYMENYLALSASFILVDSLEIANGIVTLCIIYLLTIQFAGSYLEVTYPLVITGTTQVAGALSIPPSASSRSDFLFCNVTILGMPLVHPYFLLTCALGDFVLTGALSIPTTAIYNEQYPSATAMIDVTGKVGLGGVLNVTIGGNYT